MKKYTSIRSSACALMVSLSLTAFAHDPGTLAGSKALSFTENIGQVTDQYMQPRKDIQFKLQADGMNVFAGNGQLHYQWYNSNTASTDKKSATAESYRMDVALVGANTQAEVIKEERQAGYEQFYLPHLGLNGDKAYSFSRVTYKNVYPNIDWVVYSSNNQVKYDFVVRPGGDPADIRLKYSGATSLYLKDGKLTATTPMGTVAEDKPYSYDAATQKEIASSFVLDGDILSFEIQASDKTIVIDPTINWITYYGGSFGSDDAEWTQGIAADATGNAYMAGSTPSASNIATTGSFQATLAGGIDGYLAKFNAVGIRQWATYYGGSGYDILSDVAVDNSGNVYVVGDMLSSGMATTGAFNTTGPGLVLAKFTSAGSRQWATYYYGGANDYYPYQVCCDPSGNVFIQYKGNPNLMVAKFLPNGAPQWNNPWASSADRPTDITSDLSGNIYATASSVGWDGRFARFDPNGTKNLDQSISGANIETANGIAVDAAGDIYVSGMTATPGLATPGAYRTAITPYYNQGSYDGYLMKYNSNGVLQWATYVGPPNGNTWYPKVTAGAPGKVYVSGGNISVDNYFIAEMNTSNGYPISNTVLPGNFGQKWFSNTAWSPIGMLYIVGMTQSSSGFATAGAYQTIIGGTSDPYLGAIRVDTTVFIHQPFSDTVLCAGQTLRLPYDAAPSFNSGNMFTAWLSDATGSFASPVNIGSLSSTASDTINCTIPAATTPGTGYRIRITASNPAYISPDNDNNIRIDSAVTPSIVAFTATPGTSAGPWTPIVFNVVVSGAGSTPVYVWKKNGTVISSATGSSYTGVTNVDLVQGDTITVSVTSSLACASPNTVASSPAVINVNTGIDDITGNGGWHLYPNPTRGTLTVSGNMAGEATIAILNVTGQLVYSATTRTAATEIALDKKLPDGLYLMKITSGGITKVLKFNLER